MYGLNEIMDFGKKIDCGFKGALCFECEDNRGYMEEIADFTVYRDMYGVNIKFNENKIRESYEHLKEYGLASSMRIPVCTFNICELRAVLDAI